MYFLHHLHSGRILSALTAEVGRAQKEEQQGEFLSYRAAPVSKKMEVTGGDFEVIFIHFKQNKNKTE